MPEPTAQLHATFDFDKRTRLANLYTKAPLKIAKTFALDNALAICVMDSSPGLLAGDFYEFDWELEANSSVHITTQGFTRVHPSRENPCSITQKIKLESGARLELFPEPLMLYKNASLRTETHIEMATDATVLMGEVFCAGRIGRGEIWDFHSYENRLRVHLDGELIHITQSALFPQKLAPTRVGIYENFTHSATFLAFGSTKVSVDILRAVLEDCPAVYGGVSVLEKYGLVVSLLGPRAHDLQTALACLRLAVRTEWRS